VCRGRPAASGRPGPPGPGLALAAAALVSAGGCGSTLRPPDLGDLYTRAAQDHGPERNPVIVIPGILGSRLVAEGGEPVVWGAFGGGSIDPDTPEGARLLALPMDASRPLEALRDEVVPDGALDRIRIRLLAIPVELDAYAQILATLGAGGYRDEQLARAGVVDYGPDHFTCFQFDYDWRRDIPENAARLGRFIHAKKAFVEAEMRARDLEVPDDLRFDIVAHSMGGLVARYYLRHGEAGLPDDGPVPEPTWAGAAAVDRLVLVGTPSLGSLDAVLTLTRGVRFAIVLPRYEPAVLGTMPSIYQLLPRPRHAALVDADGTPLDVYDPAVWERHGWGLADRGQDRVLRRLLPDVPGADDRRRIALDHQRRCLERARRVAAALDRPATPPAPVELHLFAADAVPTNAVATPAAGDDRVRILEQRPGDGTVLRSSALADERVGGAWTPRLRSPVAFAGVTLLFNDHLGMTEDPVFADNVLYLLLEDPRRVRGGPARVTTPP
jgi:hypothetical protein